jgi:hypothetical protein
MHLMIELPLYVLMLLGMAETTAWLYREYRHLAKPPNALVPFMLTCAALTAEMGILVARVVVRFVGGDLDLREVNLMFRTTAASTVFIALVSSWWWRFIANGREE